MEKPLIHLNGTSGQHLFDGYAEAGSALRAALRALEEAAPNARDYYPLGEASYAAARREHEARVREINRVMAEVYELAEHVTEAMESRTRR